MADFASNFNYLKDGGVIPKEQDEKSLPDSVKKAIAGLDSAELETLKKLAKASNSHITLHDKGRGITVCAV